MLGVAVGTALTGGPYRDPLSGYMEGRDDITRAQFEENLALKLRDDSFHADISPVLASGYKWDIDKAARITGRT